MNRAEILVKKILNNLGKFIRVHFQDEEFQQLCEKYVLENWDEIWKKSQKILLEMPISGKNTTLLYVTQHFLPFLNKESVRKHMEYFLSFNDDFWDSIYQNIVEAKSQLVAT